MACTSPPFVWKRRECVRNAWRCYEVNGYYFLTVFIVYAGDPSEGTAIFVSKPYNWSHEIHITSSTPLPVAQVVASNHSVIEDPDSE
jgi:hypothetical protein